MVSSYEKTPKDGMMDTNKALLAEGAERLKRDIWDVLYEQALSVLNPRRISQFIEAGAVASAILTKSRKTFVGVCIDTASTLGMCAERNAIANMITNGENRIEKVVAVMENGSVVSPCGACREYMMQLDKNSADIEILINHNTKETKRLYELIPDWWGKAYYK
jgi:cytidine deaminase